VSLRRAAGQAAFAGDFRPAALLHVAVRRSPLARARVRAADATEARALPGVAVVLTAEDAPGLLPLEAAFVGDPLAVAAAEDAELARRAAGMVRLDLEELPPRLDAEAAAASPAAVAARLEVGCGDVEAALAAADQVVSGTWQVPFSPAVALEPPLAITWLDEDRRLVVRTSAGAPFRVRGLLAARLGLPAARLRVARPLVAGGGGGRSDIVVEDLCALVTLRTGRPARLALTADEAVAVAPGRPAQRARVRLGLRDARIVALDLDLLVDLGAVGPAPPELLRSAAREALGLYEAASARVTAVAVRTNRPPGSLPRGADAGASLAVEGAIDEAAARIGEDGAAFRRKRVRATGGPGGELLAELGEAEGAGDGRALVPLLPAPRPGGRGRRPAAEAPGNGRRYGIGVAAARRSVDARAGSGAAVSLRLLEDGSFSLATGGGAADDRVLAETVAAVLTVPADHVVVSAGDTDSAVFDTFDHSSGSHLAGPPALESARLALERIREAGARLLGIPEAEARVHAGRVHDARDRAVTFAEIGVAALRTGQPLVATAAPGTRPAATALAAVEADVEVDTETGVVRVRRLDAALEGGPHTDPAHALGQVEGALALAVERALAGGLAFDAEGRPAAGAARGLPLVRANDLPALSVSFSVPRAGGARPAGGDSLAETAGRAALAAIANAVARALGVRVYELPITPARVLAVLPEEVSR
jgi:putative selenate reductase molybdopterin-binding subunit